LAADGFGATPAKRSSDLVFLFARNGFDMALQVVDAPGGRESMP
jgi:hypothetical protein